MGIWGPIFGYGAFLVDRPHVVRRCASDQRVAAVDQNTPRPCCEGDVFNDAVIAVKLSTELLGPYQAENLNPSFKNHFNRRNELEILNHEWF